MRWLLLATAVLSASAFTVHQHSSEQNCVDLQCPATAFDYGVRNLVSEETLRSDKCMTCQQCTANGYSLCLRMSSSRGRRAADQDGCSCTHSVPANCHNQLSNTRHPANITMSLFHVCYLSALQAPPRPLAVNDKSSVIVTVEPFWHEPYWRELQMENLTLHYEFVVQKPEHCEGDLITNEGDRVEHVCKNVVQLEMSGQSEEPKEEDEYDHSENYDQYDDSLPPEVQFDRDVFDEAKLLKVFYSVQVRRPRQLTKESGDPFRDSTTTLESEVLKFDLKPEIYEGGVPELPQPTEDVRTTEDDENVSEETGMEGTNFFEEETKDTKSEEQLEKQESELEKEIEKMDTTTRATITTTVAETTTEEEETTTEGEEETTTTEEVEEKEEATEETKHDDATQEDNEENDEEAKVDEENEEEEEEEATTEAEEEHTTVDEEEEKEGENVNADDDDDDDEKERGKEGEEENEDKNEEEEDSEAVKTIVLFGRKFDKMSLSSTVFAICLCSLVLITLVYCCRRQICCCCFKKDTKTASNGYRYNNPNRTNELVCSPEKERLHQ